MNDPVDTRVKEKRIDVGKKSIEKISAEAGCLLFVKMVARNQIFLEAVRKVGRGHVTNRIWAESRREEGGYPQRSLTDEQRRDRLKFAVTLRAEAFLPWDSVARSSRSTLAMLLAWLLVPRQKILSA